MRSLLILIFSLSTVCSQAQFTDFAGADRAFQVAKDLYRDELPLPQSLRATCVYPSYFYPNQYRPGQTLSFFHREATRYMTVHGTADFYGSVALEHAHGQMIGRYLAGPTARLNVVLRRFVTEEGGRERAFWIVQVPYLAYRNGHYYCFAEITR